MVKALTARLLFDRDVHYLVRDGHVVIIDEYTGRVMPDRFWNDGLHQMIETKEGCAPTGQRGSVARITYQRFFTPLSPSLRHERHAGGGHARAALGLRRRRGAHPDASSVPARRVEPDRLIVPTADAKWRTIAAQARGAGARPAGRC